MNISPIQHNKIQFKQVSSTRTEKKSSYLQENKKTVAYSVGTILLGLLTYLVTKKIKQTSINNFIKKRKNEINSQFNLVDSQKGLNKIINNEKLVETIKNKVLEPYIGKKLGMDLSSTNSLPNGMVINSKNPETGKNIVDALIEHAEGLGFRTIKIDNSQAKHQNDFSKNIRDTLKEVQEHFAKTKEYTFVDIGCLDNYAHSRRTNVEYLDSVNALLKPFENSSKKGAFWTGWSKDTSLLDDALLDRGYEFKAL